MHLSRSTMLTRRPMIPSLLLALLATTSMTTAAELTELVGGEAVQVVGDCKFTEGPAWHPDGYLLFSDIPNNRIIRVNVDGTSSDWTTDSGGANGLMCTQNGDVYACQGELRQVGLWRTGADGKGEYVKVLTGENDGKPYNKPNDLAVDPVGGVYFTDPNYRQEPTTQPVEGVYYITSAGDVSRIVDNLPRPNGVLVTQDGQSLLVANINLRQIIKYDIEAPGKISAGEVIFTGDEQTDGNGPDGMTLDSDGNIYATYKSVVVLQPDGELVGRVAIPEKPSNCAFGGDDNRTLYVTARTSLYSVPMKVAGIPIRQVQQRAAAEGAGDQQEAPAEGKVETETVKVGELTFEIPATWKSSKPTSRMRLAQFQIPAAEGDQEPADLVIYPPFGGSVAQNVQRWIGQFENEGRQLKLTQGESPQGKYVVVDATGTFKGGPAGPFAPKPEPKSDYRMLAVMLTKAGAGNYSFKLTGPKKTVGEATDLFRQSFGGDADKEKPYEF